jgi:diaminopimelate decarboxylase
LCWSCYVLRFLTGVVKKDPSIFLKKHIMPLMKGFNRDNGKLVLDDILLSEIATLHGTPAYVYSASLIKSSFSKYINSVRPNDKICFAVKSNSNISILKLLNAMGSGFDVVSGNELKRCLLAGAHPQNIVFSGVGKSKEEIRLALNENIFSINIESENELNRVIDTAEELGVVADCAIRVNPDISAESHPYIQTGLKTSKFGVTREVALEMSKKIGMNENVNLIGLACHIGSQIIKPELILDSLEHLIHLANEINNNTGTVQFLDIGGGLGITYKDEESADPSDIITRAIDKLGDSNFDLVLEPGRSIMGNAGVLLTQVEYIKETENLNFAIIDAGMNDLMRPSLYSAWHNVTALESKDLKEKTYQIVGPVCESADSLAKDRDLKIEEGSLLAIHDVGAYGYVMSSNYNTRLRPPEILIEGSKVQVIKRRESFEDLVSLETEADGS